MSLEYIRKTYGVPARIGGRIKYTGHRDRDLYGTIKSAKNGRLRVLLDDRADNYRGRLILHPTWKVEYLEDHPLNDKSY